MDRKEKRHIRQQINALLDSECKVCQIHLKRDEKSQYCVRECPVGRNLQYLSSQLITDKEVIRNKKTIEKKESFQRGDWSTDEELYLINHAPYFKTAHLAMRLNRAPVTVHQKLYRLKQE